MTVELNALIIVIPGNMVLFQVKFHFSFKKTSDGAHWVINRDRSEQGFLDLITSADTGQ